MVGYVGLVGDVEDLAGGKGRGSWFWEFIGEFGILGCV
jgi:hypothetical protein